MRSIFLALLLGLPASAAEYATDNASPSSFVIGLSPFLDNGVKDEVYRAVVRLFVQDLPLNSDIRVYDAFNLRSVTRVHVPDANAFASPKTRANQFASAIQELRKFLAQEHLRPTHAGLNFDGAIKLPQFCDLLAENGTGGNRTVSLLLIGSPLYQDEKEPGFSMSGGYFPSDGHLQASRETSVFGLTADSKSAPSLTVQWLYPSDPWLSDLHKEKVTRFWTLYLERRGGTLASLGGDLASVVQGFRRGPEFAQAPTRHWSIDRDQTKVEMLRVAREVESTDWIQRDAILAPAQRPPTVLVGPMKIGIRWQPDVDLDLYAAPRPQGETLFFQHPRSPNGYYYKDHRSSPGREYEFIEFESPVDVRRVQAFVNFYRGSCPGGPHGEVRIEFDGKIYSAPFTITAANGNSGRAGDSQQEFWTRVPVQQILKLVAHTGLE